MLAMRPLLPLLAVLALHAGEPPRPEPRMSFLDNGTVRIGADLTLGGAITHLSHRDRPQNLINSHDLGRQIQMSHYSGPIPFQPAGKQLKEEWKGIGWNPIQTGDVFGHPSRVLEHRNDGRELYVKCIPMHWPLENMPGECTYETWTTLDGATATMRFRATNARPDTTAYHARMQELPAVYVISRLHRFMAYVGERPFTGGELTHLENDFTKPWPWTRRIASEGWAALVGGDGWGLGVAGAGIFQFDGGLFGKAGSDDVRGSATAYVAPVRIESFDHDLVYEYRTVLTLGTLAEIRTRLVALAERGLPAWTFAEGRSHWHVEGGLDAGRPREGMWRVPLEAGAPRLVSPVRCWRAEDAASVELDAACAGGSTTLRLRWRCLGDGEPWNPARVLTVPAAGDGAFARQRFAVAGHPHWTGLVTGIAIETVEGARPGAELALRRVAVLPAGR